MVGEDLVVAAKLFHAGSDHGGPGARDLLLEIADHALVEIGPRMEANIMMALLAPKKGGAAKSPAADKA